MLNWAAWLRMHHQDPTWTPHVIQEDCSNMMNFNQLTKLENWDKTANISIIDTTDLTLKEVAQNVVNWIGDIKTTKDISYVPNENYTIHLNELNSYNIVDKRLFKFNKSCVPSTQKPESIEKNFIIKDGDELIAGICADIYIWKILYISVFLLKKNIDIKVWVHCYSIKLKRKLRS
ncbi:MAG: hypothetical protein ACRYGR_02130 [Janthinobacterium lividum]